MRSFLLFALFIPVCLSGQNFTIDSFNIDISLNRDGSIVVNEMIAVDFSIEQHGIFRTIPTLYKVGDNNYKMKISQFECNHDFSVNKNRSNTILKIGNADKYVFGQQTYKISYKVKTAILAGSDYNEFYWNLTGNEWPTQINNANFKITLPDSTKIRYNNIVCFTGPAGSQERNAIVNQKDRYISGKTTKVLYAGEGLTIAIKFPHNYFSSVIPLNDSIVLEDKPIPVNDQLPWAAIPTFIMTALIALRFMIKKHNHADNNEVKAYPPLDLTPSEVGAFHDQIVHDRDVVSLIPFWAQQGFIALEAVPNDKDTIIRKIKTLDGNRPDYEYVLFNALFKDSDFNKLSTLKLSMYETNYKVKNMIKKEIIDLQLYDASFRSIFRSWKIWLLVVIFILSMIASFIFAYWLVGIMFVILIPVTIILATAFPALSEKGSRVKQDLLAFYRFLKADNSKDYPKLLANDRCYFEKVYPYAIALNLDKNFVNQIKPFRTDAPVWYTYGAASTNFNNFSNDFSPKEISSAFSHHPASSSSGSSFGGSSGSSGGGFGGGGGGSW